MAQSSIEWTEMTWNPTTGCDKISKGCKFCYAEVMSRRLQAMGVEKYKNNFEVTLHESALVIPYTWKKPKVVFVNSMSDLFHIDIPIEFIQKVFKVMNDNPQHIFQVLTKRNDILALYDSHGLLNWTPNIWMGVTVENQQSMRRIDSLRNTKAHIKFLSCEPLITQLPDLNLKGIDWVIVGGESGRTPRPIQQEWVEEIQDACSKQSVPFFFKQWGGTNKKQSGRLLNGRTWDEMPTVVSNSEEISF